MPLPYNYPPDTDQAFRYGLQGAGLDAASFFVAPAMAGAPLTDWKSYVPGLISHPAAGLAGMLNFGQNIVGNPIARTLQEYIPGLKSITREIPREWEPSSAAESLGAMSKASFDATKKLIPHAEATTEMQQMGEDIGAGMVQAAAPLVPAGITGAGANLATHVLGRAGPIATPVAAGIGGYAGAASGPAEAAPAPAATNPFKPMNETPSTNPFQVMGQESTPVAPNKLPADNDSGWTDLQTIGAYAAGLATLWGAAKYGHRPVNWAADVWRGRSRDVAALNTEVTSGIARTPGNPIEMPLPNDAGGATRLLARNNYNQNAVVNEMATGIGEIKNDPKAGQTLRDINEMVNNPANANRRMEALFRSGVEEGTGHQFPKMVDFKNAVEALTPGERNTANYAAWFRNELDIRRQNLRLGKSEVDSRVNFPQHDTQTLTHQVAVAESQPNVKAWLDKNDAVQLAIVDSMERRGMITPQMAAHARANNPHFMPTYGADGSYLHSWENKALDPGSGARDLPMDAWNATSDHFNRSIQAAQKNEWRRNFLQEYYSLQQADPSLPKVLSKIGHNNAPLESSGQKRQITVHTDAGPVHYNIHNTALWQNLNSTPQMMGMATKIANHVRQFYQSMTTGIPAAMVGHPFAVTQAIRDMFLIPAFARPGMHRGYLDKLTGTRLPYDPTFPVGSAITGAKDIGTVISSNIADILSNRGNQHGTPWITLRNVLGDTKVDAIVNWIRAHVERSNLAQRTAQGVGGGGNRLTYDMNNGGSNTKGVFHDPIGDSVSPMLNSPTWDKILDRVPIPGGRGSVETYINLRQMARDLYSVISDAPHSFFHDVNKGNPRFTPRALAAHVQEVTGNPGTKGSGGINQVVSQLPFYNASVQGIGRAGAAFRDHPFSTGIPFMTMMLAAANASHLSALLSGKEHMDYLENQLSNSEKVRGVHFFHGPGTDPANHTVIPLPNELGGFFSLVSGVTGHMYGSYTAHENEDTLSRLTHMLAGLVDNHTSVDTMKQMAMGTINATVPAQPSPLTSAAIALITGKEVRNIPEQIASNAMGGEPLLSNLTTGGENKHVPPGQKGPDGLLTRADSGVLQSLLSAFGAVGTIANDMARGFKERSYVDRDWAWTGVAADIKQEWQDQTKFGNFVWQHNLKQTTYGSLAERNMGMWHKIERIIPGAAEVRGEGFSKGKGGIPLRMPGAEVGPPKDPQMLDLYLYAGRLGQGIQSEMIAPMNAIKTQIDNVKMSPFMPDEKRRIHNKLAKELYENEVKLHERMLNLNAQLSERAGGRHVDVGQTIDWQGSIDQFHH